jgi:hypothetical protein
MPGYVIHLAAAKLALDRLNFHDFDKEFRVYVGSVLADTMPRENKKASHFWSDETYTQLKRVPDVAAFEKKYRDRLDDPLVLAYLTHLRMDKMFLDEYWSGNLEFYNDDMQPVSGYDEVTKVRIKSKSLLLPRKDFLSDEYYYGDYTRILPYITYEFGLKDIFDGHNSEYIYSKLDSIDCSVIEEIGDADYKTYIMGMLENIYKTTPEKKAPELKVFNYTQFDDLIYQTARYFEGQFLKNS